MRDIPMIITSGILSSCHLDTVSLFRLLLASASKEYNEKQLSFKIL